MVNLGILSVDVSSDDDAGSLEDFDVGPRTRRLQYCLPHTKYVWDQSSDDEDDCSTRVSLGDTQRQFLDSLRDTVDVHDAGTPSSREYTEFLRKDALARKKLEEEQRSMLSALEERHRQLAAKDREAVKLVVTRFQAELAEKERLEHEKREEEERQAQERIREAKEEEVRQAKQHEARLAALEDEKALYRLVHMASDEAVENQKTLASFLAQYESDLKAFCEDNSSDTKSVKRSVKKFITLSVQQISATQEQVKRKSASILEFLAQQHGLHQKFALVTLASKMVSQCDAQIARLPSFAFPLGEVAVSVARAFPDFTKLLMAMLQNECPLCVPMIVRLGPKGGKDLKYYEALHFKVSEGGTVENEEEYVSRLQGFVRLYAAVLQVDRDQERMEEALGQAWTYVAWLLNALPACRYTASALDAFLSVAGFKMAQRYGRQFAKMMAYVSTYFLKDLEALGDADANAVATRLESYVGSQQYRSEPKGRVMPLRDISSQNRA